MKDLAWYERTIEDGLRFADVGYGNEGLKKHALMAHNAKAGLENILSKHPNWNEDAQAVIIDNFVESYESTITQRREAMNKMLDELIVPDEIDRNFLINPDNEEWLGQEVSSMLAEVMNEIYGAAIEDGGYGLSRSVRVVNPDTGEVTFENKNPSIAREGMKMTRFIKKHLEICGIKFDVVDDSGKNVNTIALQKYFDVLSGYTINKAFVLSINPNDFMLMSNGTNWASCHIINPDLVNDRNLNETGTTTYSGCYKAGTLSYMCDEPTMISYTVIKCPENKGDIWKEPKDTRMLFMYNIDNDVLMQSRQYPYTHDDTRRVLYTKTVQDIIGKCVDTDGEWHPIGLYLRGNAFTTCYNAFHYRDYEYDSYNINLYSRIVNSSEDIDCPVEIGSVATDIYTGREREDHDEGMLCDSGDYCTCDICGERIYGDNYYTVGNDTLCEECFDGQRDDGDIVECDLCHDYIYSDNAEDVEDDEAQTFCICSCHTRRGRQFLASNIDNFVYHIGVSEYD